MSPYGNAVIAWHIHCVIGMINIFMDDSPFAAISPNVDRRWRRTCCFTNQLFSTYAAECLLMYRSVVVIFFSEPTIEKIILKQWHQKYGWNIGKMQGFLMKTMMELLISWVMSLMSVCCSGMAIPEGITAYTLVMDGADICIWNAMKGERYSVTDIFCPLVSIGCLINHDNVS